MKIRTLLALVLLSACADMRIDSAGLGGADPRQEIAGAVATIDAGQVQLAGTEQYITGQRATATLQAARTQGAAQIEIERLQVQMQASQEAFDLAVVAARYTEEAARAQETRQAAETAQAAQNARLTQIAAPTATAEQDIILHETAMRDQAQLRALILPWFWMAFGLVLMIYMTAMAIRVIRDLVQDYRKNKAVRSSIRADNGRLVPLVDNQLPGVFMDTRSPIMVHGPPGPVRELGRTGIAVAAPMIPRNGNGNGHGSDLERQVIAFLERVIEIEGAASTTIPRWDKLGVSSKTWQAVIRPLVEQQVVDVQARVTTRISEQIGTVADLLDMIELGRLRLTATWPPAPFSTPVGEG